MLFTYYIVVLYCILYRFGVTYLGVCNYKSHPASQQESGEDDGGHVFEHCVHGGLRARSAATHARFLDGCFRKSSSGAVIHTTVIDLLQQGDKEMEKGNR